MKLSEAMMLGSTTCKMIRGDWNSCALGCAGNAIGIPQATIRSSGLYLIDDDRTSRSTLIKFAFPWIMDRSKDGYSHEMAIWERFDFDVIEGKMTLEQLVDYVRSIEPECGECNEYQCTCIKQPIMENDGEQEWISNKEEVNVH